MYDYYQSNTEIRAIPIIMTEIIGKLKAKGELDENTYIAQVEVFYSYPMDRPIDPLKWKAPKDALAIHLWDYSWQSDAKKNLKRIPGFGSIKNLLKRSGFLNIIKKILKQI